MHSLKSRINWRVGLSLTAAMVLLASSPAQLATKTLLTDADINWKGTYAFPAVGTPTTGGPGTTSYASGALAVRYVGGERRFLMPNFVNMDPTTGQTFGDLVEWKVPAAAPTKGDPLTAPQLVEVRRWRNWTIYGSTPAWQERTSGVRIGGLLWDEANGVLWYQLYGYYSDRNAPLLGATQLLDTDAGGGYRTVGRQYGPWWYRSSDPTDRTNLYWKAVCNWLVRVPDSSQADLAGNTIIMGGTVGAVGGAGNLGPGFRAFPKLPSLSDAPNTVLPLGLRLADYTNESPVRPSHARRGNNYSFDGIPYSSSDSGLYPPSGATGYWQMSLDQVNSFIWVDTPMKEGILLFGRQSVGLNYYGYNPRSNNPGFPAGVPDALDPTREIGNSNGYSSTAWRAALYVFDPAQVREVGRGARQPWANAMNPVAIYDWHSRWPNLPMNRYLPGTTATQARPIESTISNSGYWDPVAQEIIWIQPDSVGPSNMQPTMNIFVVGPAAPSNLHLLR